MRLQATIKATAAAALILVSTAKAAEPRIPAVDIRRPVVAEVGRYERRIAVCVGVNAYPEHPALKCAENDAAAMAGVFDGYGFDDVVLLTGDKAKRGTIMDELARIRLSAGENDLLVFFFAGHGWTVREGDSVMGYLVPFDCRSGREAEDGISMAELTSISDSMPNRHSLFLVDACYSGYGISDRPSADDTRRSLQILTAGGRMDRAFESDGHGLFTRHVLNYLRGVNDRSPRSEVSVSEMARLVRSEVASETGGWQSPRYGSVGGDDIILGVQHRSTKAAVAMAR
jgi:uncharacterized caspase-like protein